MEKILLFLFLMIVLLTACESEPPKQTFADLPTGNVTSGETIFKNGAGGAPACATCHQTNNSVGNLAPSMAGFSEIAATRINGQSAAEYTFNSIVQPSKFVVTGYSNVMYTGYDEKLTAQQIADLITYLLGL